MSRIEIRLDGRDLETRRGDGQLVFFTQITDSAGVRYQSHEAVDLNKLDENIKAVNLEYSQGAFFLPGDYQLATAILDTKTGDHVARQTAFRIESRRRDSRPSDSLPEVWRGLPPVEFIGKADSPDSWYLPATRSRLQWDASLHSPPRVNIILSVAPTAPVPGSRPVPSNGLAALLPTLKALSQMGSAALSEDVELLDLARRRAVFHQSEVHDLDWPELKKSLGEANTASIDVRSLSDRHHTAQFFVSEVRRVLRTSEKPSVLVVLATPLAFESGEDLTPVSLEALPSCRVVYIRYRAVARPVNSFDPSMRGRRGNGGRMDRPMVFERPQSVIDQLAATLKPLSPKIFDVETPEQMWKALAEVESSILSPH